MLIRLLVFPDEDDEELSAIVFARALGITDLTILQNRETLLKVCQTYLYYNDYSISGI